MTGAGRVLGLCFVCLAFLSCQEKKQEPVTKEPVYFYHYWSFTGTIEPAMATMVGQFNHNNPVYELFENPLDHEAFKTAIQSDLATGNSADVYTFWAGAKTAAITDKLLPLDDVWNELDLDSIFPGALIDSASRYSGHTYLLPITQHVVVFYYNKALFARNNLVPPATWNEFLTVCSTLKRGGVTPIALGARSKWPAQFWFDYLLLRTAGPDFRQRLMSGQVSYEDPAVVRAFSMWRDLIDHGYFNKNPNDLDWDVGAGQLLVDNAAGMTLMGSWLTTYFDVKEVSWKEGEDYGIFAFPEIDPGVQKTALGPVDGLVIPRSALHKAGAKAVLGFFSREDIQKQLSKSLGNIVPRNVSSPGFYSGIQEQIIDIIHESTAWAFNYDLATDPEISALGLNALDEFLVFPDLYRQILNDLDSKIALVRKE